MIIFLVATMGPLGPREGLLYIYNMINAIQGVF